MDFRNVENDDDDGGGGGGLDCLRAVFSLWDLEKGVDGFDEAEDATTLDPFVEVSPPKLLCPFVRWPDDEFEDDEIGVLDFVKSDSDFVVALY
jgi:hypothetical protein